MNEINAYVSGMSTIISLIIFGLEIFFVVWTISHIKKIEENLDTAKNRINTLYSERISDFNEHEKMKKKIEELEKKLAEAENEAEKSS